MLPAMHHFQSNPMCFIHQWNAGSAGIGFWTALKSFPAMCCQSAGRKALPHMSPDLQKPAKAGKIMGKVIWDEGEWMVMGKDKTGWGGVKWGRKAVRGADRGDGMCQIISSSFPAPFLSLDLR